MHKGTAVQEATSLRNEKGLVLLLKHKHIERDPRERTADMYRVVRLRLWPLAIKLRRFFLTRNSIKQAAVEKPACGTKQLCGLTRYRTPC